MGHVAPSVALGENAPGGGDGGTARVIVKSPRDRQSQGIRVSRRHEPPCHTVVEKIRRPPDARGDDGHAGGEGLGEHKRSRVLATVGEDQRGHHEKIGVSKERRLTRSKLRAPEAAVELKLGRLIFEARSKRSIAHDRQGDRPREARDRLEKNVDALHRHEAAEKENLRLAAAPRARCRKRRDLIRRGQMDSHPLDDSLLDPAACPSIARPDRLKQRAPKRLARQNKPRWRTRELPQDQAPPRKTRQTINIRSVSHGEVREPPPNPR